MESNPVVIHVENLAKRYRLGQIGSTTFRESFERAWHRLRGRDPRRHMGNLKSSGLLGLTSAAALTVEEPTELWALRDVSFDVNQGEVLAIIGRNGAGKSTLLKILSRITEPTLGRARVKGRLASLLEVGTGFHPELTGRENVFLNGAILGMRKDEVRRKFDEIVAFAEIDRFIDTPVKRYSSGMYVRLAFAVAAHLEPEILLIDEVLAVGDVAFQKKCIGKMGDVAGAGRTVLFVSHNMAAVRKLCTHAILLNQGVVEKRGLTDEVVDAYLRENTSAISASVALPPGAPEAPGRGVSLTFLDKEGQPRGEFRIFEPWRIAFEFEMHQEARHVIAGVGVVTVEAVPVVTTWSKPMDLKPGRYRVEFPMDYPLRSCDLEFAAGLSSFERPFYYESRQGHVAISEIAMGDQPVRSSGAGMLVGRERPTITALG